MDTDLSYVTCKHELREKVRVDVVSHERRSDRESEWAVFKIDTTALEGHEEIWPETSSVFRRFSDFETLRQYLATIYPASLLPPLPEKTMNFKLSKFAMDKFEPAFLEKRRTGFQRFMRRLVKHPRLTSNKALREFLSNQEWTASLVVKVNGELKKWAQTGMDSIVAKKFAKPQEPDRRFVSMRNYSDELRENLVGLLNVHNTFAMTSHQVHRAYNYFAEAANEYAVLEANSNLGEALADISEAFDSLVEASPELLRREEIALSDPLKEYVLYADSLRELLDNQETVQHRYEAARQAVKSKSKELERVDKPEGISGFFKNMGTLNKGDDERKKQVLSRELEKVRETETEQESQTKEFNDVALKELDEFDEQKTKDMKRAFLQYAKLQQAHYKKLLAAWLSIKETCKGQMDQLQKELQPTLDTQAPATLDTQDLSAE